MAGIDEALYDAARREKDRVGLCFQAGSFVAPHESLADVELALFLAGTAVV